MATSKKLSAHAEKAVSETERVLAPIQEEPKVKPPSPKTEVQVKPVKKPLWLHLATRDKVNFSRYLAVMLDAGIPLHEALEVLQEQTTDPSLRFILQTAIADLSDGLPLHMSIVKFPKVFGTFYSNALSVGESSGTLSPTLRYLATQIEKADDVKGKVTSALIYPAIIFVGAMGIAAYLAFFMLPKVLPLFLSLKVKLPPTTRALLAMSGFLRSYWPFLLVGVALLIVAVVMALKIKKINFLLNELILRLPVVGQLIQNLQSSKFSRILGTLLNSGVTIVTALNVTAESTDNPVYKKEIEIIAKGVERGETIGDELRKHPLLFSRTTSSMVGVGERTGKLSDSLLAVAEFTEREVDTATRNLSSLIEPMTLLIVGVLVGFIAMSIITPIYQITQGIHA